MLNSTTIAQLNRALENSFSNIKRDMNEIKLAVNSQSEQYIRFKKDFEAVKGTAVTTDKLNVLKIRIGELNENIKKIWDLEKQLRAMGGSKSLREAIDEVNAKLAATSVKVNDLNKHTVSDIQIKTLVAQLNAELNRLTGELRASEMRRDEVRKQDILSHTQKIINRVENANNEIYGLRKELKNYVDKNELKKVLDDLSNEFTGVKKEISNVYKRDSVFVREAEVKDILKKINDEFDGVANELNALKTKNKEFVTAPQIKGLIDDISNEFDDVKADLREISGAKDTAFRTAENLKNSFYDLRKEVRKIESKAVSRKELKNVAKNIEPETYGESVVLEPKKPAKMIKVKSHKGKFITANIIIALAFLSLLASVYSYFTGETILMDRFAISAVVAFVVGMIIRIYAVIKSSKV